jgi:hypothetical protein
VAQGPLQPEAQHRESIASRAAQAKAEGKTVVSFPSPVVSYPIAATGLTRAVAQFTVVVGTPRAIQTVIEDNTFVATWYSVTIDEVIAGYPCQICDLLTTKDLPQSMQPTRMLPIASHTMLFIRRGGTVTVDGVAVTETENGISALTIGEKYVFVVDKASSGMARLVLNDAGILSVNSNGETLTPIVGASRATSAAKPPNPPTLQELREAAIEAKKHPTPLPAGKAGTRAND